MRSAEHGEGGVSERETQTEREREKPWRQATVTGPLALEDWHGQNIRASSALILTPPNTDTHTHTHTHIS